MAKVGYTCVLTAGLQPIAKSQDVNLDMSATEVDVTTRDNAGWKEFIQGHKEWGGSINQLWVPANAGLTVLQTAYMSGSVIAATFYDEDSNGYSGSIIITGLSFGQPLDAGVTLNVTYKGTGALTPVTFGS